MKTLVVCSHADDETLGCGGTIRKLADQGEEILVLVLSESVSSRYYPEPVPEGVEIESLEQLNRACKILGADFTGYGFPDNRFDTVPLLEIVKAIETEMKDFNPDRIITHHPADVNIDHRTTFQAVMIATRPVNGCPVKDIWAFASASSTEWAFGQTSTFKPNLFVDITDTIVTKHRAMQCYETEIRGAPHPRSYGILEATAKYWGSHVGVHYAEAFEIVRSVR